MPAPRRFIALRLLLAMCVWAVAGCGDGHTSHVRGQPHAFLTAYGPSVHPPGWGHPPKGTHLLAPRALFTGLAPQDQYDTITLSSIPHGAPYLAGYTAGHWPTYGPLTQLSWHPHVTSIAIASQFHARCLDVEPGDAVPSQAPGWYHAVLSAYLAHLLPLIGGKPCLYSSFWEFQNQVIPAMRAAGIARSKYWAWDADYTFVRHLDAGFDATQYTDHAFHRNLDATAATPAFLGIGPKPKPKPKPKPPAPKPSSSYNENFTGGFQRGFIVHWDRRHHRSIPSPVFRATNRVAYNTGFQSGWRSVR